MKSLLGQTEITDVVLALLLGAGCVMSLPIYWWLFVTPVVRVAKLAWKNPFNRIL